MYNNNEKQKSQISFIYVIIYIGFFHTNNRVTKYKIKYEYKQVSSTIVQNDIDSKNVDRRRIEVF